MVDSSLNKGSSEPSSTYGNEVITGDNEKKHFICLEIEVYTFE